jgi:hypothetical protein
MGVEQQLYIFPQTTLIVGVDPFLQKNHTTIYKEMGRMSRLTEITCGNTTAESGFMWS